MNQSTIVVICALFGLAFTLYKYFASIEKRITKVELEVEDMSDIRKDIKILLEQGARNEIRMEYIHSSLSEVKEKVEMHLEEDKKHKLKKSIISAISGLMAVNPPPGSMKPAKEKPAVVKKHKKDLDEEWSEKYKKSIDCKNPKGFSQRAHCQGRKKKNKD